MKKYRILKEIKKKQKESVEMLSDLERSFAIQDLWHDGAWPISSWVEGSSGEGFFFYLRDKTETIKKFNLNEIPKVLLKARHIKKALEEIKSMGKHDYIKLLKE